MITAGTPYREYRRANSLRAPGPRFGRYTGDRCGARSGRYSGGMRNGEPGRVASAALSPVGVRRENRPRVRGFRLNRWPGNSLRRRASVRRWHGRQRGIAFEGVSGPPRRRGRMWCASSGPGDPQAAHAPAARVRTLTRDQSRLYSVTGAMVGTRPARTRNHDPRLARLAPRESLSKPERDHPGRLETCSMWELCRTGPTLRKSRL